MSDLISTRVTSTRLQDYVGQSVRLVAKTLRVSYILMKTVVYNAFLP